MIGNRGAQAVPRGASSSPGESPQRRAQPQLPTPRSGECGRAAPPVKGASSKTFGFQDAPANKKKKKKEKKGDVLPAVERPWAAKALAQRPAGTAAFPPDSSPPQRSKLQNKAAWEADAYLAAQPVPAQSNLCNRNSWFRFCPSGGKAE